MPSRRAARRIERVSRAAVRRNPSSANATRLRRRRPQTEARAPRQADRPTRGRASGGVSHRCCCQPSSVSPDWISAHKYAGYASSNSLPLITGHVSWCGFFGTPRGLGLATATTLAAFLPHLEQRRRDARALSGAYEANSTSRPATTGLGTIHRGRSDICRRTCTNALVPAKAPLEIGSEPLSNKNRHHQTSSIHARNILCARRWQSGGCKPIDRYFPLIGLDYCGAGETDAQFPGSCERPLPSRDCGRGSCG